VAGHVIVQRVVDLGFDLFTGGLADHILSPAAPFQQRLHDIAPLVHRRSRNLCHSARTIYLYASGLVYQMSFSRDLLLKAITPKVLLYVEVLVEFMDVAGRCFMACFEHECKCMKVMLDEEDTGKTNNIRTSDPQESERGVEV
jgi:hypothetical protein